MIEVYTQFTPYMAHLYGNLHNRVYSNIVQDHSLEAFIHYIRGCNVSVYRCHIYLITVRDSFLEKTVLHYDGGKHLGYTSTNSVLRIESNNETKQQGNSHRTNVPCMWFTMENGVTCIYCILYVRNNYSKKICI